MKSRSGRAREGRQDRPIANSDANDVEITTIDSDDISINDSNDESDSNEEYGIEDTQDFKAVLEKVRTISKAATVTQKRILSFDSYCQAAKLKPLCPIRS